MVCELRGLFQHVRLRLGMATGRVLGGSQRASAHHEHFDGAPIEFTLFVEPVGFDNCQATDVVTVSPGFAFDVEQQQPSCFANDGIIGVEVFEDANDPQGPFTIQLYVDGPGGTELIEELEWDNITDFYYNDLVPGDYTVVVFNNEDCIYNQSILLEDPLPLLLEIPTNQVICLGGTATLRCLLTKIP